MSLPCMHNTHRLKMGSNSAYFSCLHSCFCQALQMILSVRNKLSFRFLNGHSIVISSKAKENSNPLKEHFFLKIKQFGILHRSIRFLTLEVCDVFLFTNPQSDQSWNSLLLLFVVRSVK